MLLCDYKSMYPLRALAICVAGGYKYEKQMATINGSMAW